MEGLLRDVRQRDSVSNNCTEICGSEDGDNIFYEDHFPAKPLRTKVCNGVNQSAKNTYTLTEVHVQYQV